MLQDLREPRDEAGSEGWLRDKTDAGSLQWAEGDVGEEFGASGGAEVDGCSVLCRSFEALGMG